MKSIRKVLSVILVFTFLLICTSFPASADSPPVKPVADIATQELNPLSVRSVVNDYFTERAAFLSGYLDEIPSAVSPIAVDESHHKESIANCGINYIGSDITFSEISCWDDMAIATVEETVTYIVEDSQQTEMITHTRSHFTQIMLVSF